MVAGGWLAASALLLALAVIGGALAAHALSLEGSRLELFATANRYHFWHGLGLLVLSLLQDADPWLTSSRWALLLGTLLFSGSLYLLVLTGERFWAALTPLGGTLLIFGWLLLAGYGWKRR